MNNFLLFANQSQVVNMIQFMIVQKLIDYASNRLQWYENPFWTTRRIEYDETPSKIDTGSRTRILFQAIQTYITLHLKNSRDSLITDLIHPQSVRFEKYNGSYVGNINSKVAERYMLVKYPDSFKWIDFEGVQLQFMRWKYDNGWQSVMLIRAKNNEVIDEFIKKCWDHFKKTISSIPRRLLITTNVNTYNDILHKQYNLEDHSFDKIFFRQKAEYLRKIKYYHDANKSCVILLAGAPGTGKTSTIKATASLLNRHVLPVPLNSLNDDTLFELMNQRTFFDEEMEFRRLCFVMEDVDALSDAVLDRKTVSNEKEKPKVTLSGILNTLDGIFDAPGRMVIMTTNYPEKLDAALTRPGRINVRVDYDAIMPSDLVLELIRTKFDVKDFVPPEKSPATWANALESAEKFEQISQI